MKALPITKVYRLGFIIQRSHRSYYGSDRVLKCSVCEVRHTEGLSGQAENDDDLCVGAVAKRWQVLTTGQYCPTCQELTSHRLHAAVGFTVNIVPLPLLAAAVLMFTMSIAFVVREFTSPPPEVPQIEVVEEVK